MTQEYHEIFRISSCVQIDGVTWFNMASWRFLPDGWKMYFLNAQTSSLNCTMWQILLQHVQHAPSWKYHIDAMLGVAKTQQWVYIKCIHLDEGNPFLTLTIRCETVFRQDPTYMLIKTICCRWFRNQLKMGFGGILEKAIFIAFTHVWWFSLSLSDFKFGVSPFGCLVSGQNHRVSLWGLLLWDFPLNHRQTWQWFKLWSQETVMNNFGMISQIMLVILW